MHHKTLGDPKRDQLLHAALRRTWDFGGRRGAPGNRAQLNKAIGARSSLTPPTIRISDQRVAEFRKLYAKGKAGQKLTEAEAREAAERLVRLMVILRRHQDDCSADAKSV